MEKEIVDQVQEIREFLTGEFQRETHQDILGKLTEIKHKERLF